MSPCCSPPRAGAGAVASGMTGGELEGYFRAMTAARVPARASAGCVRVVAGPRLPTTAVVPPRATTLAALAGRPRARAGATTMRWTSVMIMDVAAARLSCRIVVLGLSPSGVLSARPIKLLLLSRMFSCGALERYVPVGVVVYLDGVLGSRVVVRIALRIRPGTASPLPAIIMAVDSLFLSRSGVDLLRRRHCLLASWKSSQVEPWRSCCR